MGPVRLEQLGGCKLFGCKCARGCGEVDAIGGHYQRLERAVESGLEERYRSALDAQFGKLFNDSLS